MEDEPTPRPTMTVGIDDCPGSLAALRYAVAEASRLGLPLRLVHVVPADRVSPLLPSRSAGGDATRGHAAVSLEVRSGSPIGVLLDEAATPGSWMVLGADHASTEQASSGCVASSVIARADRPVTVVPPGWFGGTGDTQVFVVTTPHTGPKPELVLAEEFARARQLPLSLEPAPDADSAASALADLFERATAADIVFIGRGESREFHPRMGMLPAAALHGSPCPVVVVPPADEDSVAGSAVEEAIG